MTYTLDYSALREPVTRADTTAYKQSGLGSGFKIFNVIVDFIVTIYVVVIIALMVSLLAEMIRKNDFSVNMLTPVVAVVVLAPALWQITKNTTKSRARLYKFARRNSLSYLVDISNPSYAGMIFDNGHSRQINDALQFRNGAEIGNYSYVTGSGKNAQTHLWGYARIKLVRKLPHMVLDSKSNNFWKFSNLSELFRRSQILDIGGEFSKYFTLYVPEQYERDALYVFTPDVMAAMIDYGKEFDIEIVDDELFFYAKKHFSLDDPKLYETLLHIIDTIRGELIQQTDYYADEKIGNRAVDMIAPEGRRLRRDFRWVIVIIIAILFYLLLITKL